jgi:hypothetical protein
MSVKPTQQKNVVVVTCGRDSPNSGGSGVGLKLEKSEGKWRIIYSYPWASIPINR